MYVQIAIMQMCTLISSISGRREYFLDSILLITFKTFNTFFCYAFVYSCACLSDCPMDFESQNYTIITSRCKAPQYPPKECCDAFKEFACPFAAYINNQSTNCADTMLTYINVHGSYPAGLFGAECVKGKEGVSCEGVPGKGTGVASGGRRAQGSSRSLVPILCGLEALLFH